MLCHISGFMHTQNSIILCYILHTMSFSGHNGDGDLLIDIYDFFQHLLQWSSKQISKGGRRLIKVCCHSDHNHFGGVPSGFHRVHSGCKISFHR